MSLSRTQRNANSSIRIAGGFMIWSSGIIAAPCTGEPISTICAGKRDDMQRATVSDVANSCEQEGVDIAAA